MKRDTLNMSLYNSLNFVNKNRLDKIRKSDGKWNGIKRPNGSPVTLLSLLCYEVCRYKEIVNRPTGNANKRQPKKMREREAMMLRYACLTSGPRIVPDMKIRFNGNTVRGILHGNDKITPERYKQSACQSWQTLLLLPR